MTVSHFKKFENTKSGKVLPSEYKINYLLTQPSKKNQRT